MLVRCLAMMRGGGETRHLAWMKELAALGVDVDVIAGQPLVVGSARYAVEWPQATILRSPYLRDAVYRFQNRRGFGRLTMHALHFDEEWFCRDAWRRIAARSHPPDVVHAHALHQAARLRRGDVAVVINLPGPPHPRYADDLRQADALVADGWAAANLPALGVPVQRVDKGVDAELFRPEGANRRAALGLGTKHVVLSVARLVPIKNIRLLLDAFAIVRAGDPDAHLLVVGDGPEAHALERYASDCGVASSVTFAGSVPHAHTPDYYRSADVFALSSDFDNSPNVVLEAMASGLPVVATDAGGAREFVGANGGTIVPVRQPEALARAIGLYLSRAAEARAAGESNRVRAATAFSWRASARRLLDVYSSAIAARRAGERASA